MTIFEEINKLNGDSYGFILGASQNDFHLLLIEKSKDFRYGKTKACTLITLKLDEHHVPFILCIKYF